MKREPKLPLTIISGYLGSGKTTLVNHLLRHADGRRIMVMVNDFGELPIDADLIESEDGNKINLSNGCACCSMGGDLFNALVDVLDFKPRPDHLLIEASGVADPARLANIAMAEPDLTLDSILSLVDTETIIKMIDDVQVGETISHQIATSDLIMMNKLDLVDQDKAQKSRQVLEELAPRAKLVETEFAKVPVDMALGLNVSDHSGTEERQLSEMHAASFQKWSWNSKAPIDRNNLTQLLEQLDDRIFRLKGIVYFNENNEVQGSGAHIVQYVGKRFTIIPSDLFESEEPVSRLIAIGPAASGEQQNIDPFERFTQKAEVA